MNEKLDAFKLKSKIVFSEETRVKAEPNLYYSESIEKIFLIYGLANEEQESLETIVDIYSGDQKYEHLERKKIECENLNSTISVDRRDALE